MYVNMDTTSPQSAEDFDKYFDLRWRVLRKPWHQPRGSERDELEDSAYHCLIKDDDGNAIAVGRLHYLDNNTAQIRYMAVAPEYEKRGLGTMVLSQLESFAKENNIDTLRLHAREAAVGFYEKHGYACQQLSHTLYNSIRHFLMEKRL